MNVYTGGLNRFNTYQSINQQNTKETTPEERANMTAQEREIALYKEHATHNRKSAEVKQLADKMKNGERLTPEEEAYLQAENPEMYEDAQEVVKEMRAYEKALKEVKTKEDVDALKMNTLSKFSNELSSVEHNPYIDDGKKLEIAEKISKKLFVVQEKHIKFLESEQYEALPNKTLSNETHLKNEIAKEEFASQKEIIHNTNHKNDVTNDLEVELKQALQTTKSRLAHAQPQETVWERKA